VGAFLSFMCSVGRLRVAQDSGKNDDEVYHVEFEEKKNSKKRREGRRWIERVGKARGGKREAVDHVSHIASKKGK
jgi:hypothetical protein